MADEKGKPVQSKHKLDRNFNEFVKECNRFIELFGLKSYDVIIEQEFWDGSYARTYTNDEGRVACIQLNTNLTAKDVQFQDIKATAFHEVCHLLLADLLYLAKKRFTSSEDIDKEEESVVVILEKTIYPYLRGKK